MEKQATEIGTNTGIAKDEFQNLNKVQKDRNISFETQKIMNYWVITILLYDSECRTINM